MEQLNKQIEEQADEQDIVEDLNIEGVKITKFTEEMAALFTKHQSLLGLAFEKCGLTTLEGFPKLKKLQNLEFQNNSLTGTSIKYIADNFKELINLNLSQNNIKSVDVITDLKPLASLTKLESLELKDNPLTKEAGYHKKVFQLIPSLKVLDNKNEKGEEVLDDEGDDNDDDDDLDEDDSFDESEEDDEESEEPAKPVKKTKK